MASLVVRTGGIRFGIRMARPKFLAVYGSTALSMAPSRTCKCQSSGLRMVMRAVMAHFTVPAKVGTHRATHSGLREMGPRLRGDDKMSRLVARMSEAISGTTARISPRSCGLQGTLSNRRRGRDQRVGRLFVDHRAGEIGDAGESFPRAPRFQAIDDRDHAGRIA